MLDKGIILFFVAWSAVFRAYICLCCVSMALLNTNYLNKCEEHGRK